MSGVRAQDKTHLLVLKKRLLAKGVALAEEHERCFMQVPCLAAWEFLRRERNRMAETGWLRVVS